MKINNISIVIPILNEEKNLIKLIKEIKKVNKKTNLNKFKIIKKNDNSTDNSHKVMKQLKDKNNFLR